MSFMIALQVIHLFQIAEQRTGELSPGLRNGMARSVVVPIGLTTSEELAHYGIQPVFEPSRPRKVLHPDRQRLFAQWKRLPSASIPPRMPHFARFL